MTVRPRRLVLFCGLIPTIAAGLLSLYRPALLSDLEYSVYDTIVRESGSRPPSGRVAIVDVDERSLSAIGQWPWRRDVIARLITRLRDLGASAVALDMIFPEADRHDGAGATDLTLARTLRAGGVVMGYAMTFDEAGGPSSACGRHPLGLAIVRYANESVDSPFFRATGAVCSLPVLSQSASASGFLNAAPDPDGIVRRVPLLLELNGRIYPGLALAAVSAATGMQGVALRVGNANRSSLILAEGRSSDRPPIIVPLDGKGSLLVRYRGTKRTFPYISAADVLSGKTPSDAFKNKLAFVGTTALGTREVVATPLDTLFAGVEVHATVADNLIQQDFNGRPEHGVALETQAVLGLGLVVTLLVLRFGLKWGTLGAAILLAIVWSGAISLLSANGVFLSPLFPSVGIVGSLAAMTVARITVERRRADRAGEEKASSERLMVQTLLSLTGIRDAETGRHSQRTQRYTRVLAEELATHPGFRDYLTPKRIDLLASLAPLHDIGKVGVPDRVLNKPSELTTEELAEMRRHPEYGREVIVKAEREAGVHDDLTLAIAKDIVYTHHEKWDGSGYPQGLRGTEIPIPGRVMALVDVYDAILTRRLYQLPMSREEATAFILKGSGTHFDPAVVDAFVKVSDVLHHLSEEPMLNQ